MMQTVGDMMAYFRLPNQEDYDNNSSRIKITHNLIRV